MKKPLLTLLLITPFFASADLLVHCPRLIDGITDMVQSEQTVRISEGRITSITAGKPKGSDADRIIHLEDATCLPGLMDMHLHITSEQSPTRFEDSFRLDPADYAYASVRYAELTLMAGFTTVRNLGSGHNLGIAMRNAINKGHIIGPRIIAAGKSLATTGGHADPTNGRNAALKQDPGAREGVVNGIESARKAVRQRYKDGADMIKITATGGVLSQAKSGQNPQFTDEELRTIIETARDYGFRVAAHAHGAEGMKRAIRAGITSIEHGTYMDEEAMALMKQHGTFYVPTISAGKFVAEKAEEEGYFSELVTPKARAIGPRIQATFAEAYRAGVRIAFGTDCGVCPHGSNAMEFQYMVEAGMPEMAAIQSATMAAAELIGRTEDLGSLTEGKIADLVAVPGNPVEDITAMQRVNLVIRDGVVYKHP